MANVDKKRKLPMKLVKEDAKKYNETIEVEFIDDGKVYTVTVRPYFDIVGINNVIQRIGDELNEMKNAGIKFDDRLFPLFLLYHTLIEFSDFPASKSKNVKERMAYFIEVVKTKYFKECIDVFIQEEFNKVWDRVIETIVTSEKMYNMFEKIKKEAERLELQNPEIKEILKQTHKETSES